VAMLTREHLQAVFGVSLHAVSLLPDYHTQKGLSHSGEQI